MVQKQFSKKKKIIFRIWLKNAEILYELISFKIKIFELHEFLWKKKKNNVSNIFLTYCICPRLLKIVERLTNLSLSGFTRRL